MSVVVMVRFKGDPGQLEKVIAENPDRMMRIVDDGRKHGVLHHRFVAGQGEFMVIDEWPSAEAFQSFFAQQTEIPDVIREVGVTGEPEVTVWESMTTPDQI